MVKKRTIRQKLRDKATKTTEDAAKNTATLSSQDERLPKRSVRKKITKQLHFLSKLQETQAALSARKVISKKSRKKLAGKTLEDLTCLAEFLPNEPSQKRAEASSTNVLSRKDRQKLVAKETKQLEAVLAHPAFQEDPYAAVHKHLMNTVPEIARPAKRPAKGKKSKASAH